MTTVDLQPEQAAHAAHHGRGVWPFARHYLEMVAAMVAGMVVLGSLAHGVAALAGTEVPDGTEATALLMAAEMAAGMTVWMRRRGHGWPATLEMSGAMFVPLLALFPLLWAGALDDGSLMVADHVAMFPLMALVMVRRRTEYGW